MQSSPFNHRVSRRRFARQSLVASLGLSALGLGCSGLRGRKQAKRVAFVTANLVAQVSDYRFELARWGEQHKKTVAATDEKAWDAICREIAGTGFEAIEIWEAHASPEVMNRERAARWNEIMNDHGLKAIGYAGTLSPRTAEICQWLDIRQISGGIGQNTPEQAANLCAESGMRFNIENHPQKSTAEVLKVIGGGEWLGVCVDTGWFGTQGVSAPQIIRELGALVRHTHVKDVEAAGGHKTCLLGEGVAQVAESMAALKSIGYKGWYSWEDEPEDRNPFDSAVRNRHWIEERIG